MFVFFLQTFLTVGLADVSTKLELSSEQEAEKYIRDMVTIHTQNLSVTVSSKYSQHFICPPHTHSPTPPTHTHTHTHTFTQIEDGEVHATLDQAARMVSFTENPENFDTLDTVRLMDSQLREAISLEKKLGAFDKELAGDPRYIERVSVGLDCLMVYSCM